MHLSDAMLGSRSGVVVRDQKIGAVEYRYLYEFHDKVLTRYRRAKDGRTIGYFEPTPCDANCVGNFEDWRPL